ncbi:MAG TPA: HEPN domain-containing protein [Acidobacteriaceae bacterium]|nr:HEPN domain-containing protein [Acidobacteriaceae bacterium]
MSSESSGGNAEIQHLWVTYAYEGVHWRTPERARLRTAGIRLSELTGWVDQSGVERSEGGWKAALPEPLKARVDIGEVWIEIGAATRATRDSVTLETRRTVTCKFVRPFAPEEVWQKFVMPIKDLLTVASLGDVSVDELWVMPAGRTDSARPLPQVVERAHREQRTEPPKRFWEFLFTTRDWDIAAGLPLWFDLWQRAPVAMTTFTSAYAARGHTYANFVAVASATEALHAALHPELENPTERQAARLERVLASIATARDRKWAKGLLRHGHKPPLQRRLELLLQDLGEEIAYPLVGNGPEWAKTVADARNALAHSDPRAWDYYGKFDLVIAMTETLRTVFVLTVLLQIGFDQPTVAAKLRQTRHLKHWLGRYNHIQRQLTS